LEGFLIRVVDAFPCGAGGRHGDRNLPQAAFGQKGTQPCNRGLIHHRSLFFGFRYGAAMSFIVLLESHRFLMQGPLQLFFM
jgi:hypothetical protein